jgi:hypothetical protein
MDNSANPSYLYNKIIETSIKKIDTKSSILFSAISNFIFCILYLFYYYYVIIIKNFNKKKYFMITKKQNDQKMIKK